MMGIKELFTIIFSFFNSTFPGPDLSYVALVYWLYSLNITAMAMYSTKVAPGRASIPTFHYSSWVTIISCHKEIHATGCRI